MRSLHLVSVCALIAAPLAEAQTMRSYEYTRPLRGERRLRAVVEFAAGRLAVRPGRPDRLYGFALEYDADQFTTVGSYNATGAEVHLGVRSTGSGGIRVDRRRALAQTALVEFPASVDLALDVTVGATESTLDLGGLRISELNVRSGASRTTVAFDQPNRGNCRGASIESGAGELTVTSAGNSGCRTWRLEGGVGAITIDLDGDWPANARMVLTTALGGVTLQAPKALGLTIRVSGFLAGFNAKGFTKKGKTWTSANYGSAKRSVEIEVSSAIGGVQVEWK